MCISALGTDLFAVHTCIGDGSFCIFGVQMFVNPYNFISVYGKCKKDNNIKEIVKNRELISGVIDCTLITRTSIFIPNTTNKNALNIECEDKEHKSYDFFLMKI